MLKSENAKVLFSGNMLMTNGCSCTGLCSSISGRIILNFAAGGSKVRGVFNTPVLSLGGIRGMANG